MPLMTRAFFVIPFCYVLAAANPALAKGPALDNWENAMSGDHMSRMDRAGEKLSDVIFDAIDSLKVFSESSEQFSFDVKVQRRVFDNADILNSWTVVDKFTMTGGIPLASEALSVAGSAFSNLGFWIGAKNEIEFINIRQVLPREYPNLPPPEALKDDVKTSEWYREYLETREKKQTTSATTSDGELPEPEGTWAPTGEDGKFQFQMSDPEDNARYSKLWRLLVFPFRFPMKATSLDRLEDGEIVSYRGEGALEVGASVGWNPDLSGLTSVAQMGLSYRTYISGAHRISIMRESNRFVRLKATRVATLGNTFAVGSDYKPSVLDGIIIVKDLQKQLKVIPFNFSTSGSGSRMFDVGYRYDMSNPKARKAYELAVVGRLGLSDELAVDEAGNPRSFAMTGVQKVFTRDARSRNSSSRANVRIGFVWTHNNRSSVSGVDAVITFPDGQHHVFTSEAASSNDWRLLWGTREQLSNTFTVSMDLNEMARNPEKDSAFHLMMEGRIQDTDTSEKEMTEYTLQVENSVGKPRIFPVVPGVGNLGRSHFYYQIALDNALLTKFINTPDEAMWPLVEKAFEVEPGEWSTSGARTLYASKYCGLTLLNLPLFITGYHVERGSNLIHASALVKRWKKLKTIEDPKERAEELGKLFYDRFYGYELTRLVRTALDGETISFYVSGKNNSFGRIVDQGGSQLRFENIGTKVRREIDYDYEGPKLRDGTPGASIADFSVNVVNPDRVELTFSLDEVPIALFLQLRIDNWWWPFRNEGQASLLVPNRGEFTKGQNTIVLDRNDVLSPWYPVAQEMVGGNIYSASLAINVDRLHWGPLAIQKFRLPKQPKRD